MKKVLLASTALVFAGGMAFAEVEVSGSGLMGVGNNGIDADGDDAGFIFDVGFSFTGSGETDGGVTFGGSIDHEDDSSDSGTVFVEGAFGKLSMGDVDSAADAAVGGVSGVGLDIDDDGIDYLGAGDFPAALYENSLGGATIYVSAGSPDGVDAYSVGVSYGFGNYTVSAGWEDVDGLADHWALGLSAALGDATVKAVYGESDAFEAGGDQYGISVDYVFGMTTVTAMYAEGAVGDDDFEEYGLGVSYDLGGGAALKAGVYDSDALDDVAYDFGIDMTF